MQTKPHQPKKWSSFVKYSSLGFQLAGVIGISLFLGMKADAYFDLKEIPVFSIVFILMAFTGFMYKLIKELGEK